MSALKIGGLCFGYGGLDRAVQSVIPDADLAWYAEFDKGASKIGAHRFPGVPNHGDMTAIDWAAVEPVDIITGGTPCQDLSHAGKRAGMTEGTRSNLWVAMREAIATIKPSLVIWENVGGAYSAEATSELESCAGCVGDGSGLHLRALGRVLGDLASLGFDAEWRGLRAADVGAPHGRLRVFVVAWPADSAGDAGRVHNRDGGDAAADAQCGRLDGWAPDALGGTLGRAVAAGGGEDARFLPTPTSRDHKGHNQRGDATCLTGALLPSPRTSDTNGAGLHGDGGMDLRTAVSLLPTPRAGDGEKGGPNQRGSSGDLMLPSAAVQLLPTPVVTDSTGTRNRTAGRSENAKPHAVGTTLGDVTYDQSWGEYAAAIHRWEAITRPAPAPTETGPKGSPRLSARFSEWMMGLPDGWVTDVPGITRNEALKALGNGVVPQQAAAAIADCLRAAESEAAA